MTRRALYINVQKINIKGDPSVLKKYVDDVNKCVETFTIHSDRMKMIINRYSLIDQTEQFKIMINRVNDNFSILNRETEIFNKNQNDLLRLINNMIHFDDKQNFVYVKTKHYSGGKVQNLSGQVFKFAEEDYLKLYNSIKKFISETNQESTRLKRSIICANSIWKDDQYKIYSENIYEILKVVANANRELDSYAMHLKKKIQELHTGTGVQ